MGDEEILPTSFSRPTLSYTKTGQGHYKERKYCPYSNFLKRIF